MDTLNNTFSFVMPAELVKSKDAKDEWRVRGLASTEKADRQNEIILQKGIDVTPIDEKRAILNFEHLSGPENFVGTLDGYAKTDKGLYVSGKLFKNHTKAKAIHEIMSSLGEEDKHRIGLSVQGSIIERDSANPKIIKKCQISAVAITLNPVNTDTYVDLAKSMNASENIEFNVGEQADTKIVEVPTFTSTQVVDIVTKALAISQNYGTTAPQELTGGAALSQSPMAGKEPLIKETPDTKKEDEQKKAKKKALKNMSKSLMKSTIMEILDQLQKLYPENSRDELWACLKDRLNYNFVEEPIN